MPGVQPVSYFVKLKEPPGLDKSGNINVPYEQQEPSLKVFTSTYISYETQKLLRVSWSFLCYNVLNLATGHRSESIYSVL